MDQNDFGSWIARGLAAAREGPPAKPDPDPKLNAFDAAGFTGHRYISGGDQWLYAFENGYGASVVRHEFSYGGPEGLYELAVKHEDTLCYQTPITDDVVGRIEAEEVLRLLGEIRELPQDDRCSHKFPAVT